jgi:hypothetical protein
VRALTGKERERCHDHNEDGRYERGKGDKLHGGTEATVHTKNQGKMRPAVNDGGKKVMREEIAGSERNRAGPVAGLDDRRDPKHFPFVRVGQETARGDERHPGCERGDCEPLGL